MTETARHCGTWWSETDNEETVGSVGVDMGELRGTHVPVLLERCIELLAPALCRGDSGDGDSGDGDRGDGDRGDGDRGDGDRGHGDHSRGDRTVHVDATLGLGGHAEAVLARFPHTVLIGLDRDPEALAHSRARLAPYADRIHLVHAVYDELPEVLDELGYLQIDSVLFDLGVSSLQLDEPDRGFAYAQDAPLDMRMDQTRGVTAEEVINSYSHADLARVLRVYGEEKFASRIAAAILRERQKARLTSSARLAELVRESIPAPARRTGGHPAKRTFQALRIEVNRELAALEAALPAALDALALGGRMVVLSYHSLEDRITKQALAARARSTGPVDLPVELPGTGPTLRLLSRGAELPGEAEVAANPRAASVRLRAAERIDPERDTGTERTRRADRERSRRGGKALRTPSALRSASKVERKGLPQDTTGTEVEGEGT